MGRSSFPPPAARTPHSVAVRNGALRFAIVRVEFDEGGFP